MRQDILKEMMTVAEQFFCTNDDTHQIPISLSTYKKIISLSPHAIQYELYKNKPISWVVTIPTSVNLMKKFLLGKISERELLHKTHPQLAYDAVYLCSAFTQPMYRGKSRSSALFKKAISLLPLSSHPAFFAWPTTKEGAQLVNSAMKEEGIVIQVRKKI